jgi:DNA-binding transcriptional LysR family regulator
MLDVGRLATLRAVVAYGSFSAAAEALALTQPAVSRQIALLERRLGTQLVVRGRHGARPTEAGRVLLGHAEAVLDRLALAEAQVADLAGARRGTVRLGSFFTALVHLSAEVGTELATSHPGVVIADALVDRAAALRGLVAGELDAAIVFEHAFAPQAAPPGIELVPLFTDPPRVLLAADHRLAGRERVSPRDLARDTWVRAHDGSGAQLVEHVLHAARIDPAVVLAGHGDEPVEAQAFVAAGRAVTVAHALNVLVDSAAIVARPVTRGGAPSRLVSVAVTEGQRAPAVLAVLDALREVGRRRATPGPGAPRAPA